MSGTWRLCRRYGRCDTCEGWFEALWYYCEGLAHRHPTCEGCAEA